MMFTLRWKCSP